jgi:hypothetical protein
MVAGESLDALFAAIVVKWFHIKIFHVPYIPRVMRSLIYGNSTTLTCAKLTVVSTKNYITTLHTTNGVAFEDWLIVLWLGHRHSNTTDACHTN